MECLPELSAMTMYLFSMSKNFTAFLLMFILFNALAVVGVCMLAAINEKLRKYVDLKYQIEKDKFGSP